MRTWLTGERTYEGFPLLLRRPAEMNIDVIQPFFSELAIVTHEFTKRLPNGLPDPEYNKSLAELDNEVIAAFDSTYTGIPVLVETFGGERNYYFYVAKDIDIEAILNEIKIRFPNEKVAWTLRSDPKWQFIRKYAKDFF